jgi:hypothetical protein
MQASVKNSLAAIFPACHKNGLVQAWHQALDDSLMKALQAIGMELFKAISLKELFNNKVDTFDFIKSIKKMDSELIINKLRKVIDWREQSWDYWKEVAKNPLNVNDQEKIIKIKKFLHFFCNSSGLMRSDQVAAQLGLDNYMLFHNHYIKYALKISLRDQTDDSIYNEYSDCVDPFFWIFTSPYDTMNNYRGGWLYDLTVGNLRYPLCHSIAQLNQAKDNTDFLEKLYKKICVKNHITEIIVPICQLISSITQIQKYIRRSNGIEQYVTNHSCRILQAYIKTFNVSPYVEKLKNERIFKVDPNHVKVPTLPSDIWFTIVSFAVGSIKDLLFVNTLFKNLVLKAIDDTKKSMEIGHNNIFTQKIQAIDESVVFTLEAVNISHRRDIKKVKNTF